MQQQAQKESYWLNAHLKDSGYALDKELPHSSGDCFFSAVHQALPSDARATVSNQRKHISNMLNNEMFCHYKECYETFSKELQQKRAQKDNAQDLQETTAYYEQYAFMHKIPNLEALKWFATTPEYWADELAISLTEKYLNIKCLIFDEAKQCPHFGATSIDHSFPAHCILLNWSGSHYQLVSYFGKTLFSSKILPLSAKSAFVEHCNYKFP